MEIYQELLYVHIMTRASANIDSVPRAQGKIESNMAYPDMFVQLATTLGTELLLTAGWLSSAQLFFPSLKYIAKEQDKTTKPNLEYS